MDGLLIRLLDDGDGSPGRWFWRCFQSLRSTFDRHYWLFPSQPWMGAPIGFDHRRESADFEGAGETGVCLWRPGALGRWAEQFCEEHIELWAIDLAAEPTNLASQFRRTRGERAEAFIEAHAEVWLIYTDSKCWEIFAKDASLLANLREHLPSSSTVRLYETASGDRGLAYAKAGRDDVWRAMHGRLDPA